MAYYVYLVECADSTLYCGYTTDLERRIEEHNSSDKGAKYTKGRRPVKLVYSEKHKNLSDVLKREHQIKSLSRKNKIRLIKSV